MLCAFALLIMVDVYSSRICAAMLLACHGLILNSASLNMVMNDTGVKSESSPELAHGEIPSFRSLIMWGNSVFPVAHDDPILNSASLDTAMNDSGMDSEASLELVHEEIPRFLTAGSVERTLLF